MQNIILDQTSAALIISFLIEWAKNAKWFPFLEAESGKLNRIVAVLGSGVAALGIHHSFDGANGTLMITGLTLAGIYHGGWAWLRSFIIQEIAYQKLVKTNPPATATSAASAAPTSPTAPVGLIPKTA